MESIFVSPNDLSSSDSDGSSSPPASVGSGGAGEVQQPRHVDQANPAEESPEIINVQVEASNQQDENGPPTTDVEFARLPDFNAQGHKALMTASLLEFYCIVQAAEILNQQPGSHGQYTRDSPESQILGRQLYVSNSRILSANGVLTGGIESDEWEAQRQRYRENLDALGTMTLKGLDLNSRATQLPKLKDIPAGTTPPDEIAGVLGHLDPNVERPRPARIPLERRLTDRPSTTAAAQPENTPPSVINLVLRPEPNSVPHPPEMALPSFASPQGYVQQLGVSRYKAEFEEQAMIGRGAFGAVYKVKNHVDSQVYAVKKVPLSARRLKLVQQKGGLKEIENILREIRTLARLEHPNVVRYYGAWAEYSATARASATPPDATPNAPRSGLPQGLLSQAAGPKDELSFKMAFEESDHGIVFAESADPAEGDAKADADMGPAGDLKVEAAPSKAVSIPAAHRKSPDLRSKHATSMSVGEDGENGDNENVEDDDIEAVSRPLQLAQGVTLSEESDDDIFSDGQGGMGSRQFVLSGDLPTIILHIQMSLHPFNLAQYLVPLAEDFPHHCFHLLPSLRIILGVLAGVEYLHAKGIVHRDLKPANIFLGSSVKGLSRETCATCEANQCVGGPCYTVPRIGDFGLVADIVSDNDSAKEAEPVSTMPVGTEFYHPPAFTRRVSSSRAHVVDDDNDDSNSDIGEPGEAITDPEDKTEEFVAPIRPHESLDVFALGVILFELLYRLGTRMERQMVLSGLTCSGASRQPKLPNDFARILEKNVLESLFISEAEGAADADASEANIIKGQLTGCILGMVEPDPKLRWTCKDIRVCLEGIYLALERRKG